MHGQQILVNQYKGMVKWFNNSKCYRFIGRDDAPDVSVDYPAIRSEGYRAPREGDVVQFSIVQGQKCPQAQAVMHIKTPSPRPSLANATVLTVTIESGSACRYQFLKTRPTKYGPAMSGHERNCSLRSTFRARNPSLRANRLSRTTAALRPTFSAMPRIVLKLLCAKEELFVGGKQELCTAADTLQLFINKLHTPPK